ncbi:MAG: hypothetical protein EA427_10715 [Spirochaetaceae bacterium]|nr:MAG: hypothetical protein EA427_10715 [Spirochaetaceae bacterium]
MNAEYLVRTLLLFFPVLPLLGNVFILTAKYLLRRDISSAVIVAVVLAQLASGAVIIASFIGYEGVFVTAISEWDYSIVFAFDAHKTYFLAAYLTPLLFTLFRLHLFKTQYVRMILLFYLAGCSGLLVTGDVFTFYVFYEVMIMAAYVLIGIKGKYYASIKYMIIGASSSALFLGGVILLYASGSYFGFSFVDQIMTFSEYNLHLVLLLFSTAFFVKGAFFPVSSWVSTCHTATNSLISAFLSAFTIFTGIYGLYYLVLVPADLLGFTGIFDFLRILSVTTMLLPALFLFFEPHLKRVIAGTTVFTIGFIGLMLSYRMYEVAFTYIVVHGLYKCLLFLLYDQFDYDESRQDDLRVAGSWKALTICGLGVLFTTGFFPALTYALKYQFVGSFGGYRLVVYFSMFLVLGAFFKFRYRIVRKKENNLFYLTFLAMFAIYYLAFPYPLSRPGIAFLIDLAVMGSALVFARPLYRRLSILSRLDTRFFFRNLNYELLYIVVLFFTEMIYLQLVVFG